MKRLLIFLILLLPLISAEPSFLIKLTPHYYLNGNEILVYNNGTPFDGLSFDVVAKNRDITSRIVDMRITRLSPELEGKFPNSTQILISGQEKILWTSQIVDTTKIENNSAFFYAGVEGKNEILNMTFYTEGQASYIEGQAVIGLNNPKEDSYDLIKSIGDFIWPGDWQKGLMVGIVLITIIGFMWWKTKTSQKLNRWRDKAQYEQ
mgnify:CR=1 FL=1